MELGTTPPSDGNASGEVPPIMLDNFDAFINHPWILDLTSLYNKDAALAKFARLRVIADLEKINKETLSTRQRVHFTTVEGRVKTKQSFLRKLYNICIERVSSTGLTPATIASFYRSIKDLCGVRFSCPYFDEIEPAVAVLRSQLSSAGYATNLQGEDDYKDKNYLDSGDPSGYRSYHFYVRVPTVVDIYGTTDLCLCEVQARSELQHIWAVKSHDILYKRDAGWQLVDPNVVEDMRQISNSLRVADQYLISVRDRVRNGGRPNA